VRLDYKHKRILVSTEKKIFIIDNGVFVD